MAHLKGIGVKNFRIFEKKSTFKLAPITVLTGPNNSGKSSLIKLLKLLHENFRFKNNLDEIEFHTGTHSLGSFQKIISWNSKSEAIKVVLPFPLKYFDEQFNIELTYIPTKKNSGKLDYFKIFNKKRVLVEFYNNPTLEQVIPNKTGRDKLSEERKKELELERPILVKNIDHEFLINTAFELKDKNRKKTLEREKKKDSFKFEDLIFESAQEFYDLPHSYSSVFDDFYEKQFDNLSKLENSYLNDIKQGQLLFDFFKDDKKVNDNIYYKEQIDKQHQFILNALNHLAVQLSYDDLFGPNITFDWFYHAIEIMINTDNSKEFQVQISKLGKIILKDLLLDNIKKTVKEMGKPFNSISYLSVNRGDQSRMYSAHGNMELNELLFQFDDLLTSSGLNKRYVVDFINNYLNELNIGAKLTINKIEDTAFTIKIKSLDTGQDVSLSDLGFGYSQLIPILLKIASIAMSNNYGRYSASILLLEEPEANLHPDFQSKLAELFVDAGKKFNIQFIIETHSEYLIRKLQYLTAKKEIKPEDSVIYYFHHPDKVPIGEDQVKKLDINEDGSLTGDFGPGFFDEADNIAIELFRLQRNKIQMN